MGSRMKVRFLAGVNEWRVILSTEIKTGRPDLGEDHELFLTFRTG